MRMLLGTFVWRLFFFLVFILLLIFDPRVGYFVWVFFFLLLMCMFVYVISICGSMLSYRVLLFRPVSFFSFCCWLCRRRGWDFWMNPFLSCLRHSSNVSHSDNSANTNNNNNNDDDEDEDDNGGGGGGGGGRWRRGRRHLRHWMWPASVYRQIVRGPFLFSFNNSFHSCSVLFCFLYVLWFYSFLNYVPSVLFTFITFSFVTNNELISIIFASCFICMYVCVCVCLCMYVWMFSCCCYCCCCFFFHINLWLIREQWTWENSENGGRDPPEDQASPWEDVRSHAHVHTHTYTHRALPLCLRLCVPFSVLGEWFVFFWAVDACKGGWV